MTYFLNTALVILKNSASRPPIKSPTATDMAITTVVSFSVSCLVGQVTFLSSDSTSCKNLAGAMFGNLAIFGVSMVYSIIYHTSAFVHVCFVVYVHASKIFTSADIRRRKQFFVASKLQRSPNKIPLPGVYILTISKHQ